MQILSGWEVKPVFLKTNKKNIINLSSAELAEGVVTLNA